MIEYDTTGLHPVEFGEVPNDSTKINRAIILSSTYKYLGEELRMIYQYKKCPHCNSEFTNIEGRVFSNHVRWCEFNPKDSRSKENIKKIKDANQKTADKRFGEKTQLLCKCEKCGKEFLHFGRTEKRFCSISCANSRCHSEDQKDKIRKKVLSYIEQCDHLEIRSYQKVCENCNKNFESKTKKQKYCSRKCASLSRYKNDGSLEEYRRKCAFRFNLKDFPEEFDFSLVEEYGWYSASNKGNNLGGVSRDHIVSVQYGHENDIDPKIISHPANCQLMRQTENSSKNSGCSITLDELIKRIDLWDLRYKQ